MPNPPNLSERLKNFDACGKRRFLHGVYKQLMPNAKGRLAKGEYRSALNTMGAEDQAPFIAVVTTALRQYGFHHHAEKLEQLEYSLRWFAKIVEEEESECHWAHHRDKLLRGYQRWVRTIRRLDLIDIRWHEWGMLYPSNGGIQLDAGGFRQSNPFSASIIWTDGSYGQKDDAYEMLPVFAGKELRKWDSAWSDDVLGWLPLEKAVAIAHAALSRDATRYQHTLAAAYHGDA